MRETQKRYQQLREAGKNVSIGTLSEKDLYAVGFENGYAIDVRNSDPYLPRREPTYVLAFAAGRRQKAIDIAVELSDPFSDESRLRAAEARAGACIVRKSMVERWAHSAWHEHRVSDWWMTEVPFDWAAMMKYVASLQGASTVSPIRDHVRNRLTGYWTSYLSAWRRGHDGPELLPAESVGWPVYRAAVGA